MNTRAPFRVKAKAKSNLGQQLGLYTSLHVDTAAGTAPASPASLSRIATNAGAACFLTPLLKCRLVLFTCRDAAAAAAVAVTYCSAAAAAAAAVASASVGAVDSAASSGCAALRCANSAPAAAAPSVVCD